MAHGIKTDLLPNVHCGDVDCQSDQPISCKIVFRSVYLMLICDNSLPIWRAESGKAGFNSIVNNWTPTLTRHNSLTESKSNLKPLYTSILKHKTHRGHDSPHLNVQGLGCNFSFRNPLGVHGSTLQFKFIYITKTFSTN